MKRFETPVVDVQKFEVKDVIATSSNFDNETEGF